MSLRTAFCTIATANYLPQAANLRDSIRRVYGDDCDIFVLFLDRSEAPIDIDATILRFEDIPNEYRYDMAFRYRHEELACAYKPLLIKSVLARQSYDLVVFLDADIEVFSRFKELEEAVEKGAAIVVTPHSVVPRWLGKPVNDRTMIQVGSMNAGFVAVGQSPEATTFLDWWEYVLRTECYDDPQIGYFVRDQKWIALASSYFDNVHVLKHRGYNVAHFNLSERLDCLAGELRFFHFTQLSGIDADEFFRRYEIPANDDLRTLLTSYLKHVSSRGKQFRGIKANAFDSTAQGRPINHIMRVAYRRCYPEARAISDWASVDAIYSELLQVSGASAFKLSDEMLAQARALRENPIRSRAQLVDDLHQRYGEIELLQQQLAEWPTVASSSRWLLRQLFRRMVKGKEAVRHARPD